MLAIWRLCVLHVVNMVVHAFQGANERFQTLQRIYAVLSDEEKCVVVTRRCAGMHVVAASELQC